MQTELLSNRREVGQVDGIRDIAWKTTRVSADRRRNLLDEIHRVTEALETQRP